jgi:two-component system sensor histidine kinase ChvG
VTHRAAHRFRHRSRIALRIFAFNALLVFLPVAAFSLLGSYERGLVDSLENALVQQARITAAWLGQESGASRLDERTARRTLVAIGARRTARFRVVDAHGRLLADSSEAPDDDKEPAAADGAISAPDRDASNEPLLYRLFSAPARLWRRFLAPPAPPLHSADFYASAGPRLLGSEVKEALAGRYGAATRVSSGGQLSVTLYSAVPVYAGGKVAGAVLVSQSTYRILRDLYAIRLDIARVFLGSLLAAAALSMLLALTIVGPMKRLDAAASAALGSPARPGEGAASSFPESRRSDEIGDLQRSLRGLVLRLDERMRQSERFASDAAHEFRNPLAAIRSAAELAEAAPDPADRTRFHRAIIEDSERLRAIVDGLRRLSLVEGGSDSTAREVVDAGEAAKSACDRARARFEQGGTKPLVEFSVEQALPVSKLTVDPAALDVILDNLIGNAASFARALVRVSVAEARERTGTAIALSTFTVEDDGPGIPPEHLDRVFDRFFTYRPGEERGLHTGLGLSLALALARSQGGGIEAANRAEGGARFTLTLPSPAR